MLMPNGKLTNSTAINQCIVSDDEMFTHYTHPNTIRSVQLNS